MSVTFTVFFEDPFWVGLFTISEAVEARYCRVVFGKEPSDAELYEFCRKNFYRLNFSDSIETAPQSISIKNPKRRQREISKELRGKSYARKSYDAVKQSIQQNKKQAKRKEKKQKRTSLDDHIFLVKQRKYKEKHKGY
jgi:hypothetical protein